MNLFNYYYFWEEAQYVAEQSAGGAAKRAFSPSDI
jgi:hypothetical protein